MVDNLADALEKFLLRKGTLLKEVAAALAAAAAEPDGGSTPADEMYQGKRRHPQPHVWERRMEEDSGRRVAIRRAAYDQVHVLDAKGATPMDIARLVGVSRTTVYRYLRGGPPQRPRRVSRGRQRALEPWEPYLLQRWEDGCRTATVLWREIRAKGFMHSITCVQRFCALLRLEGPPPRTLRRARSPYTSVRGPSARQVASLFLQRPERRSPAQVSYLERLRQADADSAVADDLTQGFLLMVRERRGDLDAWMTAAVGSEVAEVQRFARGLRDDAEAVQAGLTLMHSNGQTEGFINKLKLTKRSMYGRGRFDLLRQRVLRAA